MDGGLFLYLGQEGFRSLLFSHKLILFTLLVLLACIAHSNLAIPNHRPDLEARNPPQSLLLINPIHFLVLILTPHSHIYSLAPLLVLRHLVLLVLLGLAYLPELDGVLLGRGVAPGHVVLLLVLVEAAVVFGEDGLGLDLEPSGSGLLIGVEVTAVGFYCVGLGRE